MAATANTSPAQVAINAVTGKSSIAAHESTTSELQPLTRMRDAESSESRRPFGYKSPVVAAALPIGVTLGAVGVLAAVDHFEFSASDGEKAFWNGLGWVSVAAFLAGPSLGRIYVGRPLSIGLGARIAAAGILIVGFAALDGEGDMGAAFLIGGLAVGVYGAGALYEVISAPAIAYRNNRRRASSLNLGIAPINGAHDRATALVVGGRF